MKINGFVNKKLVLEDSDCEDYPKQHGKIMLSRLLACLAIGFAAAYSMFRAVIYLKYLIGL
jgi:hypothetical protein